MNISKIYETIETQEYFSRLKNIDDYIVIEHTLQNVRLLLAYVVSATLIKESDFFPQMNAMLKVDAVVQISRIPRNTTGDVYIEELLKCEVLDTKFLADLNSKYNSYESQLGAAFSIDAKIIKPKYYYVHDLLSSSNSASEQTTTTGSKAEHVNIEIPERPSLSDGGSLQISPDSPKTFTEALLKTVSDFGDSRGITYIDEHGEEEFQSYAQLLSDAKRILAGLLDKNFKPGDRAILQLTKFSDHFATFWACVLGGIIPVTVAVSGSYREANSITDKLINTWNHLKHPAILTNTSLVEDLEYLKNNKKLNNFNIVAIDSFYNKAEVSEDKIYKSKPDDLIFYQLTSGSTGTPKCIQEKHTSIISHIIGSKIFNGYYDTEVSLNWLPLDHVVPILTFHLRDVYLGYSQIMVRTMRVISQPLRWLDLLEKYKVTLSWAPNFGFKLVSDKLLESTNSKTWNLSSIHYLMNAGEQVTAFVMDEFYSLTKDFGIKENMLQPAFGMAEVCTCMTYHNNFSTKSSSNTFLKSSLSGKLKYATQSDDSAVSFVDLGPPIPGVEIRIADDNNNMINEGYIGRLQIRGNVVTPGYLYNDTANHDAFVGDGWFNTGDIGFILNNRLTLTGREKEIIIIRGANYYCYEIEDCVNSIDGVQPTYVAATSALNKKTGTEELAIFFVYKYSKSLDVAEVIKNIKQKINKNFALDAPFIIPLEHDKFPKTTSGKIQRGQLKSQLSEGKFNEQLKQLEILTASQNTLPDWFFSVKWIRDNYVKKSFAVSKPPAITVLLYKDSELVNTFIERLSNKKYIKVRLGADFEKKSDNDFEINPLKLADYVSLFNALQAIGLQGYEIVSFCSYGPYKDICETLELINENFDKDFSHAKLLLQAVIKCFSSQNDLKILFVSSFLQYVIESDKVMPQKSLISGLIKSVKSEHNWIKCCNVDLDYPLEIENLTSTASMLFDELNSILIDTEVAYRSGFRYTPNIMRASLDINPNYPSLLQANATYLISGGMGGIGSHIVKLLLQQYKARVIVLGSKKSSEVNQTQLVEYSKLGNFEYHSVDIADFERLKKFKKEIIDQNNLHLDGILHLAGMYRESAVSELENENIGSIIRVKVLGAMYLNMLFTEPKCFFTSFSSVTSNFGGAFISEYAAANRFLDMYSQYLSKKGNESRCIDWCIWEDLGVSKGYSGAKMLESKGFSLIKASEGLLSFEVVMNQKINTVIVGIDPTKIFVRHKIIESDCSVQQLNAVCASAETADIITKSKIVDILGNTITPFTLVLDKAKLINVTTAQELLQIFKNQTKKTAIVPPSGELETLVSKIIQKYLNLKTVDVSCNFFDLGANSVLLMAICDDINSELNLKLSLVEMFKYSSVKKLCDFIQASNIASHDVTTKKTIRRRIFRDRSFKHDS